MRALVRLGSAAGLLSLSPLVISVATFISVPIILGTLGPELWVSIAIGQAIGEICRSLVVWGWNSIGLTIVAPMTEQEKQRYYFASLMPRLALLVPVAVGALAVAHLIPNEDADSAARMALVGAIYGLTGGWFFIASNEPLKFVLCDALPRALSILLASLLLLMVPSPDVYGWINILGSLVAVCLPFVIVSTRAGRAGVSRSWGTVRQAGASLVRGLPIVGAGLVMVLRISFGVLAAPFVAPLATAHVSLGDKFFRWANTAITPLMQTLLVRIPRGNGTIEQRAHLGLMVAWAGGATIGTFAIIVTRYVSPLISHGQIVLGFESAIPLGIAVMMIFVAAIGGNSVLVMLGRVRQVLSAGVAALIVLVAVAIALAPLLGAPGIFWAFAASESVVVIYQSIVIVRELRSRGRGR